MKRIFSWRKGYYLKTISIFLIMVVLVAGMAGCTGGGGGAVKYDLTMAVAPSGSGTATDLTGGSPYAGGTTVSIKAVAAPGYDFVNWTAPVSGFANANAAQTTFTMPAQNVMVTANFEAEQVVVFDFVAEASSNMTAWDSGAGSSGEEAGDWALTFGDVTYKSRGWARYATDCVLEDGLTYDRVLDTNPQWVYDGFIRGWYVGLIEDVGYKIQAGDRFYAKVGFCRAGASGNVKFMVWILEEGGWFDFTTIAEIPHAYDGTLQTIDVDLSPWATDVKVAFVLGVLANGEEPEGDCAAWVEAKIIR